MIGLLQALGGRIDLRHKCFEKILLVQWFLELGLGIGFGLRKLSFDEFRWYLGKLPRD